jgi:hypothetical protein
MQKEKRHRHRNAWLATLLLIATAGGARAVELPLAEDNGVISGDVRFRVSGPNRAENVEVASWADEVYSRLVDLMHWEMPRDSRQRLIQVVLEYGGTDGALVTSRQYLTDVGLVQELRLRNVDRENQAEAAEQLIRLLLNRYAALHSGTPVRSADTAPFPDWLVYGAASHFSVPQRLSNRAVVMDAWRRQADLGIRSLLKGELPPQLQRPTEGEFFEWIMDRPDGRRILSEVVQEVCSGKVPGTEELLCRVMGFGSVRAAAQAWDLHLVSLQSVLLAPGTCTPEELAAFRESVLVTPDVLGPAAGVDVMSTHPLSALIIYRNEKWMPRLCDALTRRISETSVGRAKELQQTARLYLQFLDRLAAARDQWAGSDMTDEELLELLEQAEIALDELEYKVRTGQIKPPSATLTADQSPPESGKD